MFWENGTYNWISISDMKDREIILNTNEKITDLDVNPSIDKDTKKAKAEAVFENIDLPSGIFGDGLIVRE